MSIEIRNLSKRFGRFAALDNVVLSPHNAGQTPEVIRDGLLQAVRNVENFLKGAPTDVVVAPARA